MSFQVKKAIGWASVVISTITFIFYLEGFIFYSFEANYGFLLSFFVAPTGSILGYISRNESRIVKFFGLYGNIVVIAFGFLYWPIGERILHLIK